MSLIKEIGMFGPYTATKVKTAKGREGDAFSYTLCNGGEPVAEITNEGKGGECRIHWLPFAKFGATAGDNKAAADKAAAHQLALVAHVASLPKGEDAPDSAEEFVWFLFEVDETLRHVRKKIGKGAHCYAAGEAVASYTRKLTEEQRKQQEAEINAGELVYLNDHPAFVAAPVKVPPAARAKAKLN